MDKHQIRKSGYQRLDEQRRINNLFRTCVCLLQMEEKLPLDKIYSEEKMKAFIVENMDTVVNSKIDIHKLPNKVAGQVARERKKALIRHKRK